MSKTLSFVDAANKEAANKIKRVIAQALTEGATDEAIEATLTGEGIKNVQALITLVKARPMRLLGPWELKESGGRDGFRAKFGLEPLHERERTAEEVAFSPAFKATEGGDAEFFAQFYADKLRFDHRRGRWLASDEETGIWIPDAVQSVIPLALAAMRARQQIAMTQLDNEPREVRKAAIDWTMKGESRARLTNMLHLASALDPLADKGDHWDEDPWLLGCASGVIDLRTGQHRRALPEERVTQRVRVAFDPFATCPLWEKTLEAIFAPNEHISAEESPKVIQFMQRAIGYSITGDCSEECLFFTWGEGSNGKGTIMNTIGWLIDEYTDDMPYSTLERSVKGSGIPNDIAKLANKRFVTCGEVNEFTINESRVKAITGRDPITARFLNHEFFTFTPVCKIWIATNNKPKISGTDDGIWRRIYLISFTNKFEGANKDPQLKDKLRLEQAGILNWAIRGALMWQQERLNPPDSVRAATEAYRLESDPLTPFIESECVLGEGRTMQAGQAYEAYTRYCNAVFVEDYLRLSDKAFSKNMKRRFQTVAGRHVKYQGVGLLDKSASDRGDGEDGQAPAAGQLKAPF